MREDLVKACGKCAELTEAEARNKSLGSRCLVLERVIEELMSAIDPIKMHSNPQQRKRDEWGGISREVGAIGDSYRKLCGECRQNTDHCQHTRDFGAFVILSRRTCIPYRLEAVVLFPQVVPSPPSDLIDQITGAGIIMMERCYGQAFSLLSDFAGSSIRESREKHFGRAAVTAKSNGIS